MGIPSYFSNILRRHPKMVRTLPQVQEAYPIHHLCCDSNSIIYDAYHALQVEGAFTEARLQERVVHQIQAYVKMMAPTETLMVAFDGVAPMAKMVQQRMRRYKGVILAATPPDPAQFHVSSITPGTVFMEAMMACVEEAFLGKEEAYKVCRIVVSTSHEPGEGEQKICQFLRDRDPHLLHQENVVIYGLDADLIMLAIGHVSYTKNIHVCREPPSWGSAAPPSTAISTSNKELLLFLDIRNLTHHLLDEGGATLPSKGGVYEGGDAFPHTYVVLCFFLGNDFLPHFPSLSLRTHGMNVLLDVYVTTCLQKGRRLCNPARGVLYWNHIGFLVQTLAKMEHGLWLREHEHRDKMEARLRRDRAALEDPENWPILYRGEEHYVCPKESGWEARYYKAFFPKGTHPEDVCRAYVRGLEWVFMYYTSACPDWGWHYPYAYPPLWCDLAALLATWKPSRADFDGGLKTPWTPKQQLTYVLPASQRHLIPGATLPLNRMGSHPDAENADAKWVWGYCRYLWEAKIVFDGPPMGLDLGEQN